MIADVQIEGARHELIAISECVRWNAALEGVRHAFGHRWEHCHAFAISSGLPTYLYHFRLGEARVVCPLSVRAFGNMRDVLTPYGFAGMTATGPIPGFFRRWRQFAAAQEWVCAYLQSNPLLYNPLISDEAGVAHNTIYVLDLTLDEEKLMSNMSASRRRQLRAPECYDLEIPLTNMEAAEFFVQYAPDFFAVRSASNLYHFTDETWRALLTSPSVLALGARRAGKLEAVTVFGLAGDVADYMFTISTTSGKHFSADLLWKGIRHLRAAGSSVINLGGGISPNDKVAEFKRRFGARPLPLISLRQVFQQDAFDRLCQRADIAPSVDTGYFPPYHTVLKD